MGGQELGRPARTEPLPKVRNGYPPGDTPVCYDESLGSGLFKTRAVIQGEERNQTFSTIKGCVSSTPHVFCSCLLTTRQQKSIPPTAKAMCSLMDSFSPPPTHPQTEKGAHQGQHPVGRTKGRPGQHLIGTRVSAEPSARSSTLSPLVGLVGNDRRVQRWPPWP